MKLPFILTAVIMIVVIRHLIIILHELSHAIPALWLTKEKVTVYLGSYGKDKSSKQLSIGKLDIYFQYKMLWNNGLCRPSATNVSPKHVIVYAFLGPVVPFLIGVTLFGLALYFNFSGNVMLFGFLFFVIGLIDLVQNLVPRTKQIVLENGNVAYNDGQNIKICIDHLRNGPDYSEAMKHYNNADYQATVHSLNKLPEKIIRKPEVIRILIASQLLIRDFENALKNLYFLHESGKATPNEYCNIGYALGELGNYDKSLGYYHKAIRINPGHKYSLNNLGYTLILKDRFEEAIVWSNKAIKSDENFAFPYNNRGLAKIKLGNFESGLEDIQKSLELDPKNAYGYRNLGIYHLTQNNFQAAKSNFEKAKEINQYTHLINELIAQAN